MLGTIQSHLELFNGDYMPSETAPAINCPQLLTLFQVIIYKVNTVIDMEDTSFFHVSFTFHILGAKMAFHDGILEHTASEHCLFIIQIKGLCF